MPYMENQTVTFSHRAIRLPFEDVKDPSGWSGQVQRGDFTTQLRRKRELP